MITRTLIRAATGALALALAAIPATAPAAPNNQSCFWIHNVVNFASVDPNTLYVRASGRQVYELKLFGPCLDVDWAHHIVLHSRTGSSLCEGRGHVAEVIVQSFPRHQRCPIDSIRRLTPEEVQALPKGARP